MKNTLLTLLLGFLLFSCSKHDEIATGEFDSNAKLIKDQIRDFQLNKQFNLSEDIYNKFIEGVIIDKTGKVRGAFIAGLQQNLNEKELLLFMDAFKTSMAGIPGNADFASRAADYPGYKPISGGCQKHPQYICFGSD